ncbi:MAG: SWIM zinc finger family protein, partial [Arcobacteraceae bacterium]|nr:SWIM zinc finger family protein [Arcobacteraceae bacterium]
MTLSIHDIKDNVKTEYYSRGIEYFTTNQVIDMTVGEEETEILYLDGIVKGSGTKTYHQHIEITSGEDGNVINGYCSCPVDYNCKHIVAVCLEYVMNFKKNRTINTPIAYKPRFTPIEKWLQKLDNKSDEIIEKTNDYFLTYRLFASASYHQDELLFYKSKILKNGKISQGTALDSYKVVNENYPELVNNEDENIIQLSKGLYADYRYNRGDSQLKGKLGFLIVQELLKTKRCYFDDSKTPLSFHNSTIKSQFKLSLYNGIYSLKSNITKKEYRLLDTIPPLIVDINNNRILNFDIDIATYEKLLEAPQIGKEDIQNVYGSLKEYLPNIDLVTPSIIKKDTISSTPIVQLYISGRSFKIDFDYSHFIVSYLPRVDKKSFFRDGVDVQIIRDLDFEDEAKARIENFGFECEYLDDDLVILLKDENRQQQLKIWKEFLAVGIDTLQKDGWEIIYTQNEDIKFEDDSNIVVKSENKNDWFSLSFDIEFNGISQPIAPLVSGIINEFDDFSNMPNFINIEVDKNHFVELQTKQIQPIIQTIIELFDKKDKDENIKVSPYDAHLINNIDEDIIWKGGKDILELSLKLKDFNGISKVTPPKALTATLREYQQDGLNWLNFLYEFKFGGILADDMGLGKTIQTLTHLSKLKEDGKLTSASLIVMPTSLIANWKNEIKKF